MLLYIFRACNGKAGGVALLIRTVIYMAKKEHGGVAKPSVILESRGKNLQCGAAAWQAASAKTANNPA